MYFSCKVVTLETLLPPRVPADGVGVWSMYRNGDPDIKQFERVGSLAFVLVSAVRRERGVGHSL